MERTLFVLAFSVIIDLSQHASSVTDPAEVLQSKKYYLTSEAYTLADHLFKLETMKFESIKNQSLLAMNTFLDLVEIMNAEMARELRSAIIKFYRIKYLKDYTDYIISMEEMANITEHCLAEPAGRAADTRDELRRVVANFADVRQFRSVDKCFVSLPDEVAAAHCVLHQAVLFNGTMHDNLMTIVEIKIGQYCAEINETMHAVASCLRNFVPRLFEQLLTDAYSPGCWGLTVVDASAADMTRHQWRRIQHAFPEKWRPLVALLRRRQRPSLQQLSEPLQPKPADLDLSFHHAAD